MIGLIIGALIALFVMLPASFPRADISKQVFEAICNDRAAVLKYLTERHGEAPVGVGILGNGAGVAELHTAPDGKSWTFTVTMPNGITCVLADGRPWEMVAPVRGRAS